MPKAPPAPASTSPTAPTTTGTAATPQSDRKSMPGKYKRILLKLSGESFSKPGNF